MAGIIFVQSILLGHFGVWTNHEKWVWAPIHFCFLWLNPELLNYVYIAVKGRIFLSSCIKMDEASNHINCYTSRSCEKQRRRYEELSLLAENSLTRGKLNIAAADLTAQCCVGASFCTQLVGGRSEDDAWS